MPQIVQSHADTNRRPYLDSFRALACLLVFFYHAALNLQAGKIVFFGYNGVHLFFVLSGYLLGRKLLEKLGSGNKRRVVLGYSYERCQASLEEVGGELHDRRVG